MKTQQSESRVFIEPASHWTCQVLERPGVAIKQEDHISQASRGGMRRRPTGTTQPEPTALGLALGQVLEARFSSWIIAADAGIYSSPPLTEATHPRFRSFR